MAYLSGITSWWSHKTPAVDVIRSCLPLFFSSDAQQVPAPPPLPHRAKVDVQRRYLLIVDVQLPYLSATISSLQTTLVLSRLLLAATLAACTRGFMFVSPSRSPCPLAGTRADSGHFALLKVGHGPRARRVCFQGGTVLLCTRYSSLNHKRASFRSMLPGPQLLICDCRNVLCPR
jgi:hypothetical protein